MRTPTYGISLLLVSLVSFISLSHSLLNYPPIMPHYRKMPPYHRGTARVRVCTRVPYLLYYSASKIYYYHIISLLREHIAKRCISRMCGRRSGNLRRMRTFTETSRKTCSSAGSKRSICVCLQSQTVPLSELAVSEPEKIFSLFLSHCPPLARR